jgi:hypothetical protein
MLDLDGRSAHLIRADGLEIQTNGNFVNISIQINPGGGTLSGEVRRALHIAVRSLHARCRTSSA